MTTDAPNPLGAWLDAGLGTLIEAALHHALQTDPAALARLARLEGQQLLLSLTLPPLRLVISPHAEGIGIGARLAGSADAEVAATLPGLVRLATRPDELAGEGVSIKGDARLAAELRDIVRELNIDWEGLLAERIGDLPAHPLAELARRGRAWLSHSRDSLLRDLDNYLHEELALLPARPQLEQYYREVDALRLAADRLAARTERLAAARQSQPDAASD